MSCLRLGRCRATLKAQVQLTDATTMTPGKQSYAAVKHEGLGVSAVVCMSAPSFCSDKGKGEFERACVDPNGWELEMKEGCMLLRLASCLWCSTEKR
eukprot:1157035-Pelagomonas_calceolata.AAC.8